MRTVFSKNSTKEKRKLLRESQTDPERILWNRIRNRQLMNLKFRRQHGIGEYIADFYCSDIKLVIEIDGSHHYTEDGKEYDSLREEFMQSLGIRTVRFSNTEIINEIEKVLQRIIDKSHHHPHPT
ncbi:MAG TPA: endonuclease domain-containing protein [bacterium]|nr:endonuclease domain-containing protein [bacterium]HPS28954.1 endonuclease domain-containing protein [bacterium]